jgi:2-oxoglutarate ferredoxin oxidoreductase subunit alpha
MKLIQPIILEPFPDLKKELKTADRIMCVEANATGQLARLLRANGIEVNSLLKYTARPFFVDELFERLRGLKHE